MASLTKPLLAEESGVDWQTHVNVSPLRVSIPGNGPGQGASAVQASTDKAWAFAFKMNAVITILSAVYFRNTALTALGNMLETMGWNVSGGHRFWATICLACMLVVPSTHALLRTLLLVMSNCSALIIQFSFGLFFLVGSLAAAGLANCGSVLGAAVLFIIVSAIAGVFFSCGGRINFATAILKFAALAINSTPQITSLALGMMAVRVLWLVVAGIASLGSTVAFQTVLAPDGATYPAVNCHTVATLVWTTLPFPSAATPLSCECNGNVISDASGCQKSTPNAFLVCFWTASLGWSAAVIANVVAATVADSAATCWSSPGGVGAAWVSFRRVIHSSLGSVSKAGMVHGLFSPLQYAAYHLLLATSAFNCCLLLVRLATTHMADITVFFIGMYRLGFSEAVRRTWALFRKHGLILLFNEVALAMGLLVIGFSGFGITSLSVVLSLPWLPPSPGIVVMVIYVAGTLTMVSTFEVVLWAFKAVSICFLQDPEAFSASHDRWLYEDMYRAWREMKLSHPTMLKEQRGIQV